LHAGCDDAIKRLRRRSSRAKKDDGDDIGGTNGGGASAVMGSGGIGSGAAGGVDRGVAKRIKLDGDFNFFFATNNDIHGTQQGTGTEFGQRLRHSSFSAASGANYARAGNVNNDNVEFATPQLLPADTDGGGVSSLNLNTQWMDINSLPGLDFLNNYSLNSDNSNVNNNNNNINNNNNNNNNSHYDINTNGSSTTLDAASHRSSTVMSSKSSKMRGKDTSNDVFGYSFYDDDYVLGPQNDELHDIKLSYPKLPSTYLNDSTSSPTGSSVNNNTNNVNEYVLLSELEVPNHAEQILSVGYSFYESNDFASGSPKSLAWKNQRKPSSASSMDIDQLILPLNPESMSTVDLFTEATLERIQMVMKRYPFVGLPPPDLPSIEYLNHFVDNFRNTFLKHYPFIHKNLFNEAAMFEYTINSEFPKDYAPTVCLPLLIATIGALYTSQKKHAADLYEYSRRCIHVYLDSRKKNDEAEKSTTHNSPLWLVQSLVLSVLYGLFGEYDDSDLSIILRQVNALCTLIKVSKFNLIQFNHENIEINDQYFQDYIIYQSKVRTVFMIFNISSMLTCIYNLDPFIKYKSIKCDLPDLESYWECSNVEEFKKVCIESTMSYNLNFEKILNDMLFNNPINYKISEFGSIIMMYIVMQYFYFNKRNTLTNYSAGISPYHMNSSNLVKNYVWEDFLTDVHLGITMESIILRNNMVIRSLLIDISKIKEAMWHRRWSEVCSGFLTINPKEDDLIDACDYSVRSLSMMFVNDVDSSNFKKCVSLSLQWLFFNFFYITKFLHRFERIILKQVVPGLSVRQQDAKLIPKHFSIYIKIAKFLADLEQLLTRNFDYHDPESKLTMKEFDPSKITFGYQRLVEVTYPKEINMENVIKIMSLRLSSNMLKIGEFIFQYIYKHEATFNIFQGLGEGMHELRLFLEKDLKSS
jgi:zinc finger protein ADR1